MTKYKDPLKIDLKDTATSLFKGMVTVAIVIPLALGVSSFLGGSK